MPRIKPGTDMTTWFKTVRVRSGIFPAWRAVRMPTGREMTTISTKARTATVKVTGMRGESSPDTGIS